MVVFPLLATVAHSPHLLSDLDVVRGQHACVAAAPQILGRVKAEGSSVAQRTCSSPFVGCAVGLASIFDHDQAMLVGQVQDGIHLGRQTVQVDRDNSS